MPFFINEKKEKMENCNIVDSIVPSSFVLRSFYHLSFPFLCFAFKSSPHPSKIEKKKNLFNDFFNSTNVLLWLPFEADDLISMHSVVVVATLKPALWFANFLIQHRKNLVII